MPSKAKTPAAGDAARGGRRGVQEKAERRDDSASAAQAEGLRPEDRTRWLDQVLADGEVGNAAFVAAYAVSAALVRDGERARTSLAVIAAAIGHSRSGDSAPEVRGPLLELEKRGHLKITRGVGRGNFNRYTLLFKAPPAIHNPPLDVEPRVSLERLPALLAALQDVVRTARAAGLPID